MIKLSIFNIKRSASFLATVCSVFPCNPTPYFTDEITDVSATLPFAAGFIPFMPTGTLKHRASINHCVHFNSMPFIRQEKNTAF